ncbi:MAG: UbiA family prenyltransferase, partial [Chloroflexi bacterium]|nr:UbiA family prenyltransferase [Chloroflexota bacterium]
MIAYLVHLRLPFQILLSPIFLWGYLLADGRPSLRLALAYVALHLFGYAGGTAFNSVYDRDEGPIGGLAVPPPIPKHLLAFSLLWQAVGFGLAWLVNLPFAAIYAVMFWLSFAYSHPRLRWKGKPLHALFTVALGQGVLACLAGWATARGELGSALSAMGVATVSAVTLITTGFYP